MFHLSVMAAAAAFTPEAAIGNTQLPIGRVISGSFVHRVGVGVLVGPCTALTVSTVSVAAAPLGKKMSFTSREGKTEGTVVLAGKGYADSGRDLTGDWALLRLNQCHGQRLGYLPIARAISGDRVVAASFTGRRSPLHLESCSLGRRYRGVWQSDCNAFPEGGGTPLIAVDTTTGRPAVAGLISIKYPQTYLSGAVPLASLNPDDRARIAEVAAYSPDQSSQKLASADSPKR